MDGVGGGGGGGPPGSALQLIDLVLALYHCSQSLSEPVDSNQIKKSKNCKQPPPRPFASWRSQAPWQMPST